MKIKYLLMLVEARAFSHELKFGQNVSKFKKGQLHLQYDKDNYNEINKGKYDSMQLMVMVY